MAFSDYFDLKYFIIAFFVGITIVYFTTGTPEVIVKYPTPFNAGKITYMDEVGNCYKFEAEKQKCGKDHKIVSFVD